MRKVTFICFVVLGALIGLRSAVNDDWSTRTVMALVGVLFGAAIGGAVSSISRQRSAKLSIDPSIPGMGTSTADIAANYWRDKGLPPLVKPPAAQPDKHMFEPERLV